jgi:hypothetical protein
MQFLIVFISYLVNTQHVSCDIRASSGVLFTVHTASGYLCCYLSVALSCVNSVQKCTETKTLNFHNTFTSFKTIFSYKNDNIKVFPLWKCFAEMLLFLNIIFLRLYTV